MWLPPSIVGAPGAAPWNAADARAAVLRMVGETGFDAEISMFLTAAIATVQQITGQRLTPQTVDLATRRFADLERLPIAPVTSISWVKYLDSSGELQTVDADSYELIGAGLVWSIRLKANASWPTPWLAEDAVRVRAVAGHADAAAIDAAAPELKAAVMLLTRAGFDGTAFDPADLLVNQRIFL